MGKMPYPGVIDAYLYDDSGQQVDHFQTTRAFFTTRVQQEPDPNSSADWLKQIYIADSDDGLDALLSNFHASPEAAPGTSGCSRHVEVMIARAEGSQKLSCQAVIALGPPIPGTKLDFTKVLHISPVEIRDKPDHPLFQLWQENIIKIL
jgi:hypothetical protein